MPLIIRGPDIVPNQYCAEPVTGCDLFATFSEWAGVLSPAHVDGSSLVPLTHANARPFQREQKVLLFHYPHYGMGPKQKPQTAIIVDNFKLIKDLESEDYQLFDLSKDHTETRDLSKQIPEKTEFMIQLMQQRLLAVDAQFPSINPNYDPTAEPTRRRPSR